MFASNRPMKTTVHLEINLISFPYLEIKYNTLFPYMEIRSIFGRFNGVKLTDCDSCTTKSSMNPTCLNLDFDALTVWDFTYNSYQAQVPQIYRSVQLFALIITTPLCVSESQKKNVKIKRIFCYLFCFYWLNSTLIITEFNEQLMIFKNTLKKTPIVWSIDLTH